MEAPLWREPPRTADLDVLAVGQCSLDRVCTVARMPPVGGKAALVGTVDLTGGQVATAALACRRLGLRVGFVGRVGEDAAADRVLAPLDAAGVAPLAVRRVEGTATQIAVVVVEAVSGERTVLWYREPGLRLRAEDVPAGLIERARLLHMDAGDPEAAVVLARRARSAGIPVMLDADEPVPGVEALLRHVDFPVVSRSFAEALSENGSVSRGLERMVRLGARLSVATLGALGALARDRDHEISSAGFPVRAVDTTGAGDVFHAGFAWALLRGDGLEQVLRAANAAAALACRGFGAQGGLPTEKELNAFLEARAPDPGRHPEGWEGRR